MPGMGRVMGRTTSAFWKELRWGDGVVLGALLFVVAMTSLPRPASQPEGSLAVVRLPDRSERPISLEQNEDYTFPGLHGPSVLRVEDGTIRFIDSTCPNKLCVQSGRIRQEGEIRVCLPNQVWVTIQSDGKGSPVDAVSH